MHTQLGWATIVYNGSTLKSLIILLDVVCTTFTEYFHQDVKSYGNYKLSFPHYNFKLIYRLVLLFIWSAQYFFFILKVLLLFQQL